MRGDLWEHRYIVISQRNGPSPPQRLLIAHTSSGKSGAREMQVCEPWILVGSNFETGPAMACHEGAQHQGMLQ